MKDDFIESNVNITIVFNKKNIYKYLKIAIPLLFVLMVYKLNMFNNIYKNDIEFISGAIEEMINDTDAENRKCILGNLDKTLKVMYVFRNDVCYKYVNGDKVKCDYEYKPFLDIYIIEDRYSIIEFNINDDDYVYIINNFDRIYYILTMMFFNVFILFFIFTIMFFMYVYKEEKTKIIERLTYELELEGKLQRTLAESAHHEMLMPLSLIKSIFNDFILKTYPCQEDFTKVCEFVNSSSDNQECDSCVSAEFNRDIDEVSREYISSIGLAIEQLESVLNQMSETKEIKHSNGNISIHKLITNSVNTLNSANVNKLLLEMRDIDKELLKKYSVKYPLNNGNMLNIFSNHLTNSKDANSTIIRVKTKLRDDHKIDIYLGDNGKGIRDKYGEVITGDVVFNNGYSTKDKKNVSIVIERTFKNKVKEFINRFLNDEVLNDGEIKTGRGFGLFINKKILNKAEGDVTLVDTSTKGTVFKLTIPIKIRKD